MNKEEAVELMLKLVEVGGSKGKTALLKELVCYIRNLDGSRGGKFELRRVINRKVKRG